MIQKGRFRELYLLFGLVASLVGGHPTAGLGEGPSLPEAGPAAVVAGYPFAVGGSARKALPQLDCLGCTGPAPGVPCDGHRRGFLYYGTCAAHDDCTNGFCDCPHGDCGQCAVGLSKAWIHLHRYCRQVSSWLRGDPCGTKRRLNDAWNR
jgi:hypothetical protein